METLIFQLGDSENASSVLGIATRIAMRSTSSIFTSLHVTPLDTLSTTVKPYPELLGAEYS